MENKNTGLIITIVILITMLFVTLTYITYDKLYDNNIINEKNNESTVEKPKEIGENSYEIFANNMKNQISTKYDEGNCNFVIARSVCVEDGYTVELKKDGGLYITYHNNDLKRKYNNYKIADNVLSFYIINSGQFICNTLYYIKDDGTVSMANTEYGINENQLEIKDNIGNYKNIVSIVEGIMGNGYSGTHGPIFMDINGNIYSEDLK